MALEEVRLDCDFEGMWFSGHQLRHRWKMWWFCGSHSWPLKYSPMTALYQATFTTTVLPMISQATLKYTSPS